jgi:ABC-type sulfate transport system substrate-binding protein
MEMTLKTKKKNVVVKVGILNQKKSLVNAAWDALISSISTGFNSDSTFEIHNGIWFNTKKQ